MILLRRAVVSNWRSRLTCVAWVAPAAVLRALVTRDQQYSLAKVSSALLWQNPRCLLPGCTVDRALPRCTVQPLVQSRHVRQFATPVRHGSSAMECHNAYVVDPTVYAATYTASTGASPMRQEKTPLGQRVYMTIKCIQQEILHHCSTTTV